MRLADSLHKSGRNGPALEALEKARQAGAPASAVNYHVAVIKASLGDRAAALDSLSEQGGMIHFYGALTDGVMDFYTDSIKQLDGSVLQRHLRFFNLPTGQVRQLSEGSTDNGRTWSVEYDFTYSRVK